MQGGNLSGNFEKDVSSLLRQPRKGMPSLPMDVVGCRREALTAIASMLSQAQPEDETLSPARCRLHRLVS